MNKYETLLKKLSPFPYNTIREELLLKILKKIHQPEERVRYCWILKLINEYGYESKQIDINIPAGVGRNRSNVYADIVVYRDSFKTEPFIVGEVKKENAKDNIDGEQGASYARNLGAEYHFWSNKTINRYWKTAKFPNKSLSIGNLPIWVGKKPIIDKIKKTETLLPFKNIQELRQVITVCHDLIYKEGHDPAYAFDELTKLLFLKLYDERETPNYYEFVALAGEEQNETIGRIQELIKKATEDIRYKDVFMTRYNKATEINLDLTPNTIYAIVQQFQGYSLVNTTENIHGADIKGTAYETMVGGTFRGELGQYFTPRELVEFMVNLINPDKTDTVLDPACGSGGFLIMCIKHVKDKIKQEYPNLSDVDINSQIKTFSEHNIYGLDINPRMARVAKMNMIMHGDGHTGVFNLNGLMVEDDMPRRVEEELKDENVKIIFSNPPFAGYENNPEILKQFELGQNKNGKPISITPEVLFIEKIIRLLEYGGKAALVLPAGCFNNISLRPLRDYIRSKTKIIGIIGLPHLSFQVSGANNEGNLLFLEKVKEVPEDYNIFIDWAGDVGFDATGKKTGENDLNDILKRWRAPESKNIIKFSQLEERIDPWYYHPNYIRLERKMRTSKFPLKSLTELIYLSTDYVNKKDDNDKIVVYVETNDVDLLTGTVYDNTKLPQSRLPNRAKYILKENDILIPNARDCVRGIAIALKEHIGFVVTNRFFVVRPNKDTIELKYLYYLLKQPEIHYLMKRQATGEINPSIAFENLNKVMVPVPESKEKQIEIVKQIEKYEKQINKMQEQITELQNNCILEVRGGIKQHRELPERAKKLGSEYIHFI